MELRAILNQFAGMPGVKCALILGRDGMLVETSEKKDSEPPDVIAAISRDMIIATERMSADMGHGNFIMGIIEFSRGVILIANVSRTGKLLIMAQKGSNFADLWNAVGSKFAELRQALQF